MLALRDEAIPPSSLRSPLLEDPLSRILDPSWDGSGNLGHLLQKHPSQDPKLGVPCQGWSIPAQLVAHLRLAVYL